LSSIFFGDSKKLEQVLRTSAKNQLDSYADEWIISFEGLQNALDAVEDVPNPRIKIVFDLEKNKVSIYDNGNGFPCSSEYFGLGYGEKFAINNHNIRGEHGVGMKMIIICSKQFELITRNRSNGKLWYASFKNGYRFLEEDDEERFNDTYLEFERLPNEYNTLIEYTFPKADEHPLRNISVREFISNIFTEYEGIKPHEELLKNRSKANLYIEHYFRTHSYTGDVNRLFDNKKPAEIEVVIMKDTSLSKNELKTVYDRSLIDYWNEEPNFKKHIIKFKSKYWDILDFFEEPLKKGIFTENMLTHFSPKTKYGGSNIWVMKILDKELLRNFLVNVSLNNIYEVDKFNTLIQEKIRGIYLIIASAATNAKYNVNNLLLGKAEQIIAADGVLTTNPIRSPKRGKNQSYLNNIHIVININDRVNYGKQAMKSPNLLSYIYKFFEQIYVSRLVNLAISVAGKMPNENEYDYNEPEIVISEVGDILDNLSIKKVPQHENTLIALFYELIGRGIIRGIETYYLSSYEKYDGKINIFSNITNDYKKIRRNEDLMVVEFKVNLSDLIKDFIDNSKSISDLNLIVIWNGDIPQKTEYYILNLENSAHQYIGINGIDEVLADMDGNQVPILILKNYVNTQNNKKTKSN